MRHWVEVSPPFFFVFFFLVAVVLCVRYANAEPTFLKAQPRSQCHPHVKAQRAGVISRSWCSLLVLFLHVHVLSLCTIYIHFAAFKVTIDWSGSVLKWGFVLAGHWLVSPSVAKSSSTSPSMANCSSPTGLPSWQNNSSPSVANSWIRRLRDKVISKCNPESRWWLSMVNLNTLNSWNSSSRTDKIVYIGLAAAVDSKFDW